MAIDDNTIYGLYGSQIKELPGKIDAVKGLARVLTADDYNWPTTGTKTAVALWLLDPGIYYYADDTITVRPYSNNTTQPEGIFIVGDGNNSGRRPIIWIRPSETSYYQVNSNGSIQSVGRIVYGDIANDLTTNTSGYVLDARQGKVLKDLVDSLAVRAAGAPTTSTAGSVGTLYEDTTNGKLYICTDATNPYTWEEVGGGSGPTVVQTTGTSTTDVMSQNATTSMVFKDPSTKYRIAIGNSTTAGANECISIGSNANSGSFGNPDSIAIGRAAQSTNNGGVALGLTASANYKGAIAIGTASLASAQGEMNIGSTSTAFGYNSSNYRLLTGVYDPQNAHDAATKGYVDTSVTGKADITYVDAQLDGKQDELTAGTGITITDESGALVISATATEPDTFTTNEWNALWA